MYLITNIRYQVPPEPRPPNVPLIRALWPLFGGTWGLFDSSWVVLEPSTVIPFWACCELLVRLFGIEPRRAQHWKVSGDDGFGLDSDAWDRALEMLRAWFVPKPSCKELKEGTLPGILIVTNEVCMRLCLTGAP